MKTQSFSAKIRLKKKEDIGRLFSSKNSIGKSPLRMMMYTSDDFIGLKILVAVPKRKLKRAVERNRMKRIIREVIRKNKSDLETRLAEHTMGLVLGVLYNAGKVESYSRVEEAFVTLVKSVEKEMIKDVG